MTFPDHFSSIAASYARYRPTYSEALFDWVTSLAPARDVAWDCACGSGQAALPLAERFNHVIATDASADQLRQAPPHSRIEWRVATAEASGIVTGTVDLITVAQALHWFDLPRFWVEVRRVLRPRGVFTTWSYGIAYLADPEITAMVRDFHDNVVGSYWPIERGHVDARYQGIDVPLARIAPPPLELRASWTLEQMLGYLRTWSATRRYLQANGDDPVAPLARRLEPLWAGLSREVLWPLTVLAGRNA